MIQNCRIHNSQAMQSNITFAKALADDKLPSPPKIANEVDSNALNNAK